MNTKILGIFAVLIAGLIAMAGFACATPSIKVKSIEVNDYNFRDIVIQNNGNGIEYKAPYTVNVERGETLVIKTLLIAVEDSENVQVSFNIYGYNHIDSDGLSYTSTTFNMKAGDSKRVSAELNIPLRMPNDGEFSIVMKISDRQNGKEYFIPLKIDEMKNSNALAIKDVYTTPQTVQGGRTAVFSTLIKNYGDEVEDVLVKVSIPALGLSDFDTITKIREDKSVTSEELMLQIPACAGEGTYKVITTVTWEDGDYSTSYESDLVVVESEVCNAIATTGGFEEETSFSIGTVSTEIQKGKAAAYPVSVTNFGPRSRTYTLSIEGTNGWATVNVNPTNTFVVKAGETKNMFVEVMPNTDAAAEGQHMFTATLSSGADSLTPVVLTSNVAAAGKVSGTSLSDALKIGLVILVVILVILALVVGFNKLKGSDDNEELDESGQTYY